MDRLSIGALGRSSAPTQNYPMDGYIGILAVIPAVVTQEERVLLMQWMADMGGIS
ncbi:MAG: hypothetical protein NT029_22320 [Armatimonadetes bacterium]|nr:hypothetical protein [Armatimonadota bacterium]